VSRKVLRDSNGLLFCGLCGATRSRIGELWGKEESVLAHLKHCKGEAGLAQEKQEIREKLAAVPIPVPQDLPAGLPQNLPQGAARSSGSLPAATLGTRYRPAPLRAAGSLPAGPLPEGIITQSEYDALNDAYQLKCIEADEYRQLAEAAVAQEENHTPHLALAQVQQGSSDWLPWILGAGVVGLIVYGLASSSGDEPDARPSMSGRSSSRKSSSSSGVGDLFDLGSKGLSFLSKARNAFKI